MLVKKGYSYTLQKKKKKKFPSRSSLQLKMHIKDPLRWKPTMRKSKKKQVAIIIIQSIQTNDYFFDIILLLLVAVLLLSLCSYV